MKRFITLLLIAVMTLCCLPSAFAASESEEVIILYTNDVHCAVDENNPEGTMGYANLAALKAQAQAQSDHVVLIDAGDAIQGDAIGTLSDGDHLVSIMNYVGYDYAVYGNHEFDYGMDVALALSSKSNAQYLSCNFMDLTAGNTVAAPYSLATYGDLTVGYVGIATPETLTKSSPVYFQDDTGRYIYGFCEGENGAELYAAVQTAVDEALADGADIIIAIGHLGVDPASAPWRSYDVIANTAGIDAFIDGHSHTVIENEQVSNKNGEAVLLTSTGTKLEAIGMMTVTQNGEISTRLVTDFDEVHPETDTFIKNIQSQFEAQLNEVVGYTEFALVINDPETDQRIIRSMETNLGDFVADAYRTVLNADVGIVNGGGIRASIAPGEITYGELISVHPYGNTMCVVEVTGKELLDTLEVTAQASPGEFGSFSHVSGLRYTINTAIESTVVMDDKGMLQSIGDTRRVSDVQILCDDGSYTPIDPEATYTLASHNYMIKEGGNGVNFFSDNRLIMDEVMLDNQLLIQYIKEYLGGEISEAYADPYGQGRITIIHAAPDTDEQLPQTGDTPSLAPAWTVLLLLPLTALVLPRRKGEIL